MFIQPDEHIIIMEDDTIDRFTHNDTELLKEAGIQTIIVPHSITRMGYSLPHYHKDFKLLLPFYYSGESFVDQVNDKERIKEYAQHTVDSKHDGEDIQFIFGIPDGGEFFWDAVLTKDFPVSDERIIDFIVDIQKILVQQYGEIWLCLHNYLGHPQNWNNTRLPILYQALVDEFPGIPFYSIQYAHFACGHQLTDWKEQSKVIDYTNRFGIQFFVGSEYCEGLTTNFDAAVAQKVRGFVTSPMHSLQKKRHTSVEPWMVEAIKETNRRFNGRNSLES